MITVEDFNSILLKYQNVNIFHEIDLSKIDLNEIEQHPARYDFCTLEIKQHPSSPNKHFLRIWIDNSYWTGLFYLKYEDDEILHDVPTYTYKNSLYGTYLSIERFEDLSYDLSKITVGIHICANPASIVSSGMRNNDLGEIGFIPLQPTEIGMFGDDFNNKFYIKTIAPEGKIINYTLNGDPVPVFEDEKGEYLEITSESGVLGVDIIRDSTEKNVPFYKYVFKEYRTIPQITIDNLYLGCRNKIKLYYDGVETDNFEVYYQGNLLKDKIIDMRTDLTSSDINLTIKITDSAYYNTSVQINALCELFTITNQDDLNEAIENKYNTITFAESFDVEDVPFDYPLKIINSHLSFVNCSFVDDLILKDCVLTLDEEDYIFKNLTLEDTTISKSSSVENVFAYIKVLNQLKCYRSILTDMFVHCGEDAIIDNNIFNDSLIFSDNQITISNSTFNGCPTSDYPNMLYLTGEYNVMNNNFILTGIFDALTFNMCIIKTLKGFDVDKFIANNNYNVNITIDEREYNSFTYCLVDDDTIYTKG